MSIRSASQRQAPLDSVRRQLVALAQRPDVQLRVDLRPPDLALHLRRHVLVRGVGILAVERALEAGRRLLQALLSEGRRKEEDEKQGD